MHSGVQLQHPEVTRFSTSDPRIAGCGDAASIAAQARGASMFCPGPHMPFPALGSLRKEGMLIAGCRWYLPINGDDK